MASVTGPIPVAPSMTVGLTEFAEVRHEINARSDRQHLLLSLNLTAIGAIGTVVAVGKSGPLPLLILGIISSCLGINFFDHDEAISRLGHYIREELAPAIREQCGDPSALGWEDYYRQQIATRGLVGRVLHGPRRFAKYGLIPKLHIPLLLMFAAPSIIGLVLTATYLATGAAVALWVITLVVLIVFSASLAESFERRRL